MKPPRIPAALRLPLGLLGLGLVLVATDILTRHDTPGVAFVVGAILIVGAGVIASEQGKA